MKIRITDPNGVVYAGKIVPKGETLDIQKGPHTEAWLRFDQAEVVKEKAEKPDPKKADSEEADPKKGEGKK